MTGGGATGDRVADRVATTVVIVASAWFAFAAGWGLFGLPSNGHLGAGAAGNVMAAEQIVRWKIPYPAWEWFTGVEPSKTSYLCHHPYGQYYVPAFLYWLLGHHDYLLRFPAVLMSAAMPPLLYGIGKARWGAPIGAVAAASYTVVPIAVGFASYWNLETICIFGALLFFWGHSRHMVTGQRRHLAASLMGLGFTCAGDWVGYLIVAPVLAWAVLRGFVLPAWMTPRLRQRDYARWWALSVTLSLGMLVYWIALFHHADAIKDWLASGSMRGGGADLPLHDVLVARKDWLYFSFTPLAIKLGRYAAPLCALRLVVARADEEIYALAFLFGAAIQYVVFREGADIHIFWPHYFAAYFALAMAQLARTIASVVGWVVGRFSPPRARNVAAATGLAVGLMPAVAMAHDGVASLWVWRRTGGRYDDKGTLIDSETDMLVVLRDVIMPWTRRGTRIDAHPSVDWYWQDLWEYEGNANIVGNPLAGNPAVASHPFWIARGRGLSADEEKRIASISKVRIYGDAWVVDQREPVGSTDAYSVNEREPNPIEWLLLGGTETLRSIGPNPDPWLTWEWRTHLDQPAPLPTGEPVTIDQIRIAHNVAIAQGDSAAAERWRRQIESQLDLAKGVAFDHGVSLLGVRLTGGVEPRVEAWFECMAKMGDAAFNVRSTIESKARFSLIPPDTTDREMAYPPSLATKLWRPEMIYKTYAVLNHRIGRERYWGTWTSRDGTEVPRRIDGETETTLAVVP
jgi:hypothetical protein